MERVIGTIRSRARLRKKIIVLSVIMKWKTAGLTVRFYNDKTEILKELDILQEVLTRVILLSITLIIAGLSSAHQGASGAYKKAAQEYGKDGKRGFPYPDGSKGK